MPEEDQNTEQPNKSKSALEEQLNESLHRYCEECYARFQQEGSTDSFNECVTYVEEKLLADGFSVDRATCANVVATAKNYYHQHKNDKIDPPKEECYSIPEEHYMVDEDGRKFLNEHQVGIYELCHKYQKTSERLQELGNLFGNMQTLAVAASQVHTEMGDPLKVVAECTNTVVPIEELMELIGDMSSDAEGLAWILSKHFHITPRKKVYYEESCKCCEASEDTADGSE